MWGMSFADMGPSALLALTIVLVLLGWLVPRGYYRDKSQEAERWRLAYEAEREARRISDAQTAQLLEQAKTTHQMVEAIFDASDRVRRTGGAHVAPSS